MAKPRAAKSQPLDSHRAGYVVVLVTCATRREALRIARAVVSGRLAACVSLLEAPVRSVYRWKGKVEDSREFLLLVKTSRVHLDDLYKEITRLHSYAVPEFIALPIVAGSADYLSWFAEAIQRPTRSKAKI